MTLRLLASLAILLAIVAAAGCGDDDADPATLPPVTVAPSPAPLDEYLKHLQDAFQAADDRAAAAERALEQARDAAPTFVEERDALADFLAEIVDAGSDAIIEIESLAAPGVIQAEVRRFAEATALVLRITEEALPRLADAQSSRDLERVLNDMQSDLAPHEAEADNACRALQRAADDQDINVDLGCGA